jgi:hypothetical protein
LRANTCGRKAGSFVLNDQISSTEGLPSGVA